MEAHFDHAHLQKLADRAAYGRRNRLIMPPAKRNRAFPTGNALLYILLVSVNFQSASIQGALCFCFEKKLEK